MTYVLAAFGAVTVPCLILFGLLFLARRKPKTSQPEPTLVTPEQPQRLTVTVTRQPQDEVDAARRRIDTVAHTIDAQRRIIDVQPVAVHELPR